MPVPPKKTRGSCKRVTGERVLTSTEGFAILKEKEDKKLREAEEKQKRKEERESKKKEKEEIARKKAEEKAKKVTASVTKKRAPKRGTVSHQKAKKTLKPASTSCDSSSISAPSNPTPTTASNWECCECLCTYEDDVHFGHGETWVECACSRWIHEKCIDKIVTDSEGKERFCSFCVL